MLHAAKMTGRQHGGGGGGVCGGGEAHRTSM